MASLDVKSQTLIEPLWITDSTVRAVAKSEKHLYLGGDFTYLGPNTGSLASVHMQTGKVAFGLPRVNGTIKAMVTDSLGGTIIAGNFTQVDGIARNRLARITPEHQLDPAWDVSANGEIFALELAGNKLFMGGAFTEVSSTKRNHLAVIDAYKTTILPWNPDVPIETDTIYTLALYKNKIIVAGNFSVIAKEIRHNLACLDTANTSVTTWDPHPNGPVNTIAIRDTLLYVAGNFSQVGAIQRKKNGVHTIDKRNGNRLVCSDIRK